MLATFSSVRPISSRPLSRQCLRWGSISKEIVPPSGPVIGLAFQIHRQHGVGTARRIVHQGVQLFRRDDHGQDPVLEAVVVEDIGKRRGDDTADTPVEQRPRRMFAGGAAAEIVTRHQNLRLAVGRFVEHEIGVFRPVLVQPHFGEQPFGETGALDRFQVILRDDHVGVDVDDRQGRGDAGEAGEGFHGEL